MARWKSVLYVVTLTDSLPIEDLPMAYRSDEWWDEFWRVMGLKQAQKIRRRYESQT